MAPGFLLYRVSLVVATAIAFGVAIHAWRNRGTPGATSVTMLLLGEALWAGCAFAMTVEPIRGDEALTTPWTTVLLFGSFLTVLGAFFFMLEYTGRERFLTPRWIAVFSALPAVTMLVALVSPEPLIWEVSGSDPYSMSGLDFQFGPLFRLTFAYIYVLLAVATVWILRFALTSDVLYRGQIYGILVAVLVPWAANVVHHANLHLYNPTPVAFAIAGAAYGWTIFRGELFDISPIARRTVV